VRDERALDLRGADAVPGHVEHVVDAAGDPDVALRASAKERKGRVGESKGESERWRVAWFGL
jgi:hypothetical protein